MKVLVYPHDLNIGGSQLNAIEAAAAVRDLGHDVLVYGRPGVLVSRIHELGLRFRASPAPGRRPSPRVVRDLHRLIAHEGIDIVHGYEWPPILEARLACRGTSAVAVGTVMSMAVAPFVPNGLPLTVGTRQIAAHERARGRRDVYLMEPPVDLETNRPGPSVDVAGFRTAHDIPDGLQVVVVSRLADELKGEGLRTAVREVPRLHPRAVLTVVGDGPGRAAFESLAAEVESREGRRAVVLAGEVADPRPAYAMADICLGMGGSALRAMAFGKPLVVQGEQGFWCPLTPETLPAFRWGGWYGVGRSPQEGPRALGEALQPLLDDPELRRDRGAFSREVVRAYGLRDTATKMVGLYEASAGRPAGVVADAVSSVALARYKGGRLKSRIAGSASRDDFNAVPVAANGPTAASHPPLVVWLAGVDHGAVEGTEHRLVDVLTDRFTVLWVDPPTSALRHVRSSAPATAGLSQIGPRRWRLHTVTTPGPTRPFLRELARRHQARGVRRACTRLTAGPPVAVVADPWGDSSRLPVSGMVFLCTDDFVAGAELMGVDRSAIAERVRGTLASADVTLAVSPTLAGTLGGPSSRVRVFPNGCDPAEPAQDEVGAVDGGAILVGQLNDRLDVEALIAVAECGVPLTIVGPRCERRADTTDALDRLLRMPGVTWTGRVPHPEIAAHLAASVVGLTPYLDTEFNRASFPLKTLEYLAAGVPAVSTDLPASRWLDTPFVDVTTTPSEFADRVQRRIRDGRGSSVADGCRAVAARNTWQARGDELADLLLQLAPPTPQSIHIVRGDHRVH